MDLTWAVLFGLVGLSVGSFLNVCIDRLPERRSLLRPPSHCDGCGRRLAPADMVPVLSYLRLRGRCRYCGAAIPRRVLWVELVTGLLFGWLGWSFGPSLQLLVLAAYGSLFTVVSAVDLERGLILNRLVYPAAAVTFALVLVRPEPGIISALLGASAGFALFLAIVLASRGGMGWGDVKLAGLIGLATGTPIVFVALFVAVVSGGLAAAVLLLLSLRKRKEAIPFGPFLCLGAMTALIWGPSIRDWYVRVFF